MKARFLGTMVLLASGCSEVPRDPEGTLERVKQSGVLRIGVVAETGRSIEDDPHEFIVSLAQGTGSRPGIMRGSTETLLPKVQGGELDIVIGSFAADTPWITRVTFLPALEQMNMKEGEHRFAAAVRNGENRWVAFVHDRAAELSKASR